MVSTRYALDSINDIAKLIPFCIADWKVGWDLECDGELVHTMCTCKFEAAGNAYSLEDNWHYSAALTLCK